MLERYIEQIVNKYYVRNYSLDLKWSDTLLKELRLKLYIQ